MWTIAKNMPHMKSTVRLKILPVRPEAQELLKPKINFEPCIFANSGKAFLKFAYNGCMFIFYLRSRLLRTKTNREDWKSTLRALRKKIK